VDEFRQNCLNVSLQDLLAHLDLKGILVQMGQLDKQVQLGWKDLQEIRDWLVLPVKTEEGDHVVKLAPLAGQATLDHQVSN
jgi:hypothetical protein